MSTLRPVRGTHDLLGEDILRHRHVGATARAIAGRYGYGEIATPILEHTEVFDRTLGETSDVVAKEMYTFTDRGGDSVTLRPENTAGVVRAVVTNGLTQALPVKLFYEGPMFRYERPQKGRLRQFHQIGVECIGAPEPEADVEVIALSVHTLRELGLGPDVVTLELNTLGDLESRSAYRQALVGYLSGHKERLSADSLARLDRNPLRILDSKDEGDRAVIADAPLLHDFLSTGSRAHLDRVQALLTRLGIAYRISPKLVRGLDYYVHTAFEITTTALGAQGTVLGGGRYDGLMRTMGGPDVPGVGWAAGVERLAMLLALPPRPVAPVAIVPIGERAEGAAWDVVQAVRDGGIAADLGFKGKPGQRLKRADRIGARHAVILGDAELDAGVVKLKDLATGTEETVPRAALAGRLKPHGAPP
jgi:histidyl-tRNA synthetase